MLSETAKKIAEKNIVVDKMHFRGHIDEWCSRNCNPNDFDELRGVSTCTCSKYLLGNI